jgi:hypothetical protein
MASEGESRERERERKPRARTTRSRAAKGLLSAKIGLSSCKD